MKHGRQLRFDDAGWRLAGQGGARLLSNTTLETHGGPGLFWYAPEVFEDFRLSVEWRVRTPKDNSGVFLRIPPLSDSLRPATERGYEVQIDDRGWDPEQKAAGSPLHLSGAIYRLAPALRHCSHPIGEWNRFEISAHGPTITVNLNGERVAALYEAAREPRGHIALQCHHDGSAVQFRDLSVMLPG
jgi:hypothetical protein